MRTKKDAKGRAPKTVTQQHKTDWKKGREEAHGAAAALCAEDADPCRPRAGTQRACCRDCDSGSPRIPRIPPEGRGPGGMGGRGRQGPGGREHPRPEFQSCPLPTPPPYSPSGNSVAASPSSQTPSAPHVLGLISKWGE